MTAVTPIVHSPRSCETQSLTDDIYCTGVLTESPQLARSAVIRCSVTLRGSSAFQLISQQEITESSLEGKQDMIDKLSTNHFVWESVWR